MIYTFYSFKGGVGRSAALANIAYLFYQKGLRVVVIDWDLEAPGIGQFFTSDNSMTELSNQLGLIDLLLSYKRAFPNLPIKSDMSFEDIIKILDVELPPIKMSLIKMFPEKELDQLATSDQAGLWLLPPGMYFGDEFSRYAENVQNFDWKNFYNHYQGEAYFEWLRSQLTSECDVVLIDSRTGVTEMGGVCTRQLADIVVMVLAANEQNLTGITMMAQSLSRPELKNMRRGRSLKMTFIPSRIEAGEAELLDEFERMFDKRLTNYYPIGVYTRTIFSKFKIPYVPYYAYQEKLAVQETDRPSSVEILEAYNNIVSHLSRLATHNSILYKVYNPPIENVDSFIRLKDVLITARQESHRMRHYYLGVEHLFIALCNIRGGLVSVLLQDLGFSTDYVIDAVRRKIGKGGRHRLWAGTPNTPRTEVVLDIANEIALEHGRDVITEKDLTLAILEEGDSLAVYVLGLMDVDLEQMYKLADIWVGSVHNVARSMTNIQFELSHDHHVDNEHLGIISQSFPGYDTVRIVDILPSTNSESIIYRIHAIEQDNRITNVLLKINKSDYILDEVHRYERYAKSLLPTLAVRLEDLPILPISSNLGALKYAYIDDATLCRYLMPRTNDDFESWANWLRDGLYSKYGEKWWKQQSPYRFEAWREFDFLLPPILTVDLVQDDLNLDNFIQLHPPIKLHDIEKIESGDLVVIENYIVNYIDRENNTLELQLGIGVGESAYRIKVRNVDLTAITFFRGEIVERLGCRVWQTRAEILKDSVRLIEPVFDLYDDSYNLEGQEFQNPLYYYKMLEMTLESSLSTIHGNLVIDNILLLPDYDPLIIDYASIRDGCTLHDWAQLFLSLTMDVLYHDMKNDWHSIYLIALEIAPILTGELHAELKGRYYILMTLQTIVQELLMHRIAWKEWQVAVLFYSIKLLGNTDLSISNRRLAFLIASLAIERLQEPSKTLEGLPDDTDHITNS